MAVTLTTVLPPTRSGRTLFLSLSALGAFAVLQMAMLCWHLLRSSRQHPANGPVIHFAETTEPSAVEMPFQRNSPGQDASISAAGAFRSEAESAPLPTPAAPSIDRPAPAASDAGSVAAMIEHARRLRLDGDATTALAELRQAQMADPSSPQVIAELGITYEAMQLTDRAFEQWQRLYAMGDSIGALYYLADAKLHSAPAAAAAPGAALTGPGVLPSAEADAARSAAGAQDNVMLKITDIEAEEENDPAAEKKVALKIIVKNRPGSAIDPNKVQIYTFFYDLVDGKDVVLTNAQTDHRWLTNPVTWEDDKAEVLETTYFRPKAAPTPAPAATAAADDAAHGAKHGRKGKGHPAEATPAAAPAAPAGVRTYYGYTVRLYYDRQLQNVKANPVKLLQQFPPPLTLTEQ